MSTIPFNRPRRRQPLVILSLLLNILLLGVSMMLWSGGGMWLSTQHTAAAPVRGAANTASGFEYCDRPVLSDKLLHEWGCKVLHKACFDQDRLLLHSGEKTPGSPTFKHGPLFEPHVVPAYLLPGYEEPLGTSHFLPKCWDFDIRAPTHLDPQDVWQPAEFTTCTVPLVWWVTYFSVFADLYIGSALSLDSMLAEGAYDKNVTLAPVSLGMDPPPWYQTLLEPYTRHRVQSLSSLSSREHIRTGQPRCFERAILCNMVGMYTRSPGRDHGWLQPKTTGRRTVEHYRKKYPERFLPHEKLAAAENGTVFRVAFQPRTKLRSIVNLDQVVEECQTWKPPSDTKFRRVECVLLEDGTAHNFPDLLAQVQNVHALVNTHGSGNVFAFFMPPGRALVEILPWNFHGKGCSWADQYFSDWFVMDHSLNSGYFRLVADRNHTLPGVYEREKRGASVSYGRDSDVVLHFPTLIKALEKVARGQLECTYQNLADRTFYMTRKDLCPASEEYQEQEQQRKKKEEEEKKKEVEKAKSKAAEEAAAKEAAAAAGGGARRTAAEGNAAEEKTAEQKEKGVKGAGHR